MSGVFETTGRTLLWLNAWRGSGHPRATSHNQQCNAIGCQIVSKFPFVHFHFNFGKTENFQLAFLLFELISTLPVRPMPAEQCTTMGVLKHFLRSKPNKTKVFMGNDCLCDRQKKLVKEIENRRHCKILNGRWQEETIDLDCLSYSKGGILLPDVVKHKMSKSVVPFCSCLVINVTNVRRSS